MDRIPRHLRHPRADALNPIGLPMVRLLRREGCVLYLEGVDMLDGTPLHDLKPYVLELDPGGDGRSGWLEQARGRVKAQCSDNRFGPDGKV